MYHRRNRLATLAILGAVPAAGDIVHTDPPDVQILVSGPNDAWIDIDSDGAAEYDLNIDGVVCGECGGGFYVTAWEAGPQEHAQLCTYGFDPNEPNSAWVRGFDEGALINGEPAMANVGHLATLVWNPDSGGWKLDVTGDWADPECGPRVLFAGLEFDIGGQQHFGWARIGVDCEPGSATLYDFAYETEPGLPIVAGDTGRCYSDFTFDGTLDLFDFLAYVNAFNVQDPSADCDGDGDLTLFDFLCFVNVFNEGC